MSVEQPSFNQADSLPQHADFWLDILNRFEPTSDTIQVFQALSKHQVRSETNQSWYLRQCLQFAETIDYFEQQGWDWQPLRCYQTYLLSLEAELPGSGPLISFKTFCQQTNLFD